jgi:hypothetical protein
VHYAFLPRLYTGTLNCKVSLLRSAFWGMSAIARRTESVTHTETAVTDGGEGNIVETEQKVTDTILYITVAWESTWESAEHTECFA